MRRRWRRLTPRNSGQPEQGQAEQVADGQRQVGLDAQLLRHVTDVLRGRSAVVVAAVELDGGRRRESPSPENAQDGVVLPEPFRPIRAVMEAHSDSADTPLRMSRPPSCTFKSRRLTRDAVMGRTSPVLSRLAFILFTYQSASGPPSSAGLQRVDLDEEHFLVLVADALQGFIEGGGGRLRVLWLNGDDNAGLRWRTAWPAGGQFLGREVADRASARWEPRIFRPKLSAK